MKTIVSQYTKGAIVPFPAFTGEQVYMLPIDPNCLGDDLSRWRPTIDAMLDGVNNIRSVYLMIDQREVKQAESHRKPGPHVDYYWNADANRHGSHRMHSSDGISETLILAASSAGCAGYIGSAIGPPSLYPMGDCSKLDLRNMRRDLLECGYAYRGDTATWIHESLPALERHQRTLVRLNVKHCN